MTNEAQIKLLTVWASPYGMRAALALDAKGLTYEKVQENLAIKSKLLLDSNPVHKKVPVLIHEGKAICESAIIIQYVDQTWPSEDGHDLLPKDPYDRAVALFWGDFIDKKIFDVAGQIPRKFFRARTRAIAELKKNLEILDNAFATVPKEKPFFGGATPGYVDILLAPLLAWQSAFEALGKFKLTFEEFPALDAWKKAVEEGSTMKAAMPDPEKLKRFVLKLKKKIIKKLLVQMLCPCTKLFSAKPKRE